MTSLEHLVEKTKEKFYIDIGQVDINSLLILTTNHLGHYEIDLSRVHNTLLEVQNKNCSPYRFNILLFENL